MPARTTAAPAERHTAAPVESHPAAPPISPFAPSSGWHSGPEMKLSAAADPAPAATVPAAAPARAITAGDSAPKIEPAPEIPVPRERPPAPRPVSPFPAAAAAPAKGFAEAATLTEGALAKAPEAAPAPAGGADMDALRTAVVTALNAGGHESAAQMLGTATWKPEGGLLRIEVPGIGKKMLGLTVNAVAEKIIRRELKRLGGPPRFMAVPGTGSAAAAPVAVTHLEGSIQQTALADPLVVRAQEMFKAQVRSVLDLRQK
jgi:DNA polymerase-3 subunit gamma/tau